MNSRRVLRQILSPDCDPLRNLLAGVHQGQHLTQIARSGLSPEEGAHLYAVRITEKGLVLWADSPAWATRIRYAASAVGAALRDAVGVRNIKSIQVKVLPREMTVAKPADPVRKLSRQSADHVAACAAHIDDPKLQAALMRLSTHRTID